MVSIEKDTLMEFIHLFCDEYSCDKKETLKVRHYTFADRYMDFGSKPENLMNRSMLNKFEAIHYVKTLFLSDPTYNPDSEPLTTEFMKEKFKTKEHQNYAHEALRTFEDLMKRPGHNISIQKLNLLLNHQEIYRKNTNIQIENCHRMINLLSTYAFNLEKENRNFKIKLGERTKNQVEAVKKEQVVDINQKTKENYQKTELLTTYESEIVKLKQKVKQLSNTAKKSSEHIVFLKNHYEKEITSLKEQNSQKDIEIQNLKEKIDQKDKEIKNKFICNSITVKKTKKGRINRNRQQFHLTMRYTDGVCHDKLYSILKGKKISLDSPIKFQFQMIRNDPEMSMAKCCFPDDFDKDAFIKENNIQARPWVKGYDDKVNYSHMLKKRVIIPRSSTQEIRKDLMINLTELGHAPILTKAYKKRNHSIVILIFGSNDKDKIEEIYNLDLDQILSEEYICKCSWWKPKKPKNNLQNENSNSTSFCSLDSIN
jgi:hypothetical protein